MAELPEKPEAETVAPNGAGQTDENAEPDIEGGATDDESKPIIITCGVCEKVAPKYKCPRCYLPYCSVACNKIHRETHAGEPEPAPKPIPKSEPNPEDDDTNNTRGRKFKHPWRTLQHSEELQWLFKKYPRLPDQLLEIHSETQPPPVQKPKIPASMMKDLPQQNQNNGWDKDKGIKRGKEALRKARKLEGEDGEAIREYSELVLHIMEEARARKDG